MKEITEDYVSFETAKLLKEKGFDLECDKYFIDDGKHVVNSLHEIKDYAKDGKHFSYLHNTKIAIPTQQKARKWLRNLHNLTVECLPYMPWDAYETSFADIHGGPVYKGVIFKGVFMLHTEEPIWAETYEVACDAIIKYCLENLI